MDACFTAIGKSPIVKLLLALAENAVPEAWVPYYNFKALPIDDEFVAYDPTLARLRSKREFMAGVLEVAPNTCYMWHADTDRNASVNMLLKDDGQSKCVFAPSYLDVVTPIVELKYEPDTLYAFNTKVLHTVLNFSEPRYLLSIEFLGADKGLTYDELRRDLELI